MTTALAHRFLTRQLSSDVSEIINSMVQSDYRTEHRQKFATVLIDVKKWRKEMKFIMPPIEVADPGFPSIRFEFTFKNDSSEAVTVLPARYWIECVEIRDLPEPNLSKPTEPSLLWQIEAYDIMMRLSWNEEQNNELVVIAPGASHDFSVDVTKMLPLEQIAWYRSALVLTVRLRRKALWILGGAH